MDTGCVLSISFPVMRLKSLLGKRTVEVIRETGVRVQEFYKLGIEAIGIDKEYVHMLFQGTPEVSPDLIVKMFKITSAHEILMRKPALRKSLLKDDFLLDSYYVAEIGHQKKRAKSRVRI